MAYTESMLLPVICGSLAFLLFIGYSLWLWIKKPKSIIINKQLSDLKSILTLYVLIIVAMDASNQWLYIAPIALSVVILFISMVNNRIEKFDI